MTSNYTPNRQRTQSGHFRKGVSGNPGGRPKALTSVTDEARTHTALAISTLVEILKNGNQRARVAAAKEILDRGWGRPIQAVDLSNEGAEPLKVVVNLIKLDGSNRSDLLNNS